MKKNSNDVWYKINLIAYVMCQQEKHPNWKIGGLDFNNSFCLSNPNLNFLLLKFLSKPSQFCANWRNLCQYTITLLSIFATSSLKMSSWILVKKISFWKNLLDVYSYDDNQFVLHGASLFPQILYQNHTLFLAGLLLPECVSDIKRHIEKRCAFIYVHAVCCPLQIENWNKHKQKRSKKGGDWKWKLKFWSVKISFFWHLTSTFQVWNTQIHGGTSPIMWPTSKSLSSLPQYSAIS